MTNGSLTDNRLKGRGNTSAEGVLHDASLETNTPSAHDLKHDLIFSAISNGDHRQAIEICSEILKESPGDKEVLFRRARSYLEIGERALAMEDFNSLLETASGDAEKDLLTEFIEACKG